MGNCAEKSAPPGAVSEPTMRANRSNQSNNEAPVELANFLSLDHPLNVNRKYNTFFEILKDQHVGAGIKKTNAYKSKIPLNEIEKKRNEYWETRLEGSTETWQALRSACEADEQTALAIVGAVELKLVNKTLQLSYDARGNKYDVPIFCINNPKDYDLPKKKQIKSEDLAKHVKIKLRRMGVASDVALDVGNDMKGSEVKQEYLNKIKDASLTVARLRLFFGGREITNDNVLAEYGIQDEHVLQIFVRKD